MKIDLLLCGRRAYCCLQRMIALFGSDWIAQVVSYEDPKTANDPFQLISEICQKESIAFRQRTDYELKDTATRIAIGWQYLLPMVGRTIVVHDSLLPKYRGFAPLVTALINGDDTVGVTAFLANEKADSGPMVAQQSIRLQYPVTIEKAQQLLLPAYYAVLEQMLPLLFEGGVLPSLPQNEQEASYSLWRDEHDYWINWNDDAANIRRFVDAVGYPYAGAKTLLNNEPIVIAAAEEMMDVKVMNRKSGKIIFINNGIPVVVCGSGLLRITQAFYAHNQASILPWHKLKSRMHFHPL
jgi:methionyl-tRNA formyltransferase